MHPIIDPLARQPEGPSIGEHRAAGRRRLAALPLWVSLPLLAAAVVALALFLQGEYAMIRLIVDTIIPEADAGTLQAVSVTATVAYLACWHFLGFRVAQAAAVMHEVAGSAGQSPRRAALATLGWFTSVCTLVLVGVLVAMSYVRADNLAGQLADDARRQAVEEATTPPTPAELDAIAARAYDEAFGADLLWTLLMLTLLALAAMVVGLAMHSVGKSAQLGIAEARLGVARLLADRAATHHLAHQRRVTALTAAKTARASVAAKRREELTERYTVHAPQHARIYLAARKGTPEFTDHLVPKPAQRQ
ncbi:MAG: hypothetical protein QM662_06450 [Gordonia sp. (in: high G+C Gram-positive bacteria)]